MKDKVWMVALLVITAFVSAGMLAVINIKTAPIVKKNNEIKLKKSVLDVFSFEYEESNIESLFDEKVEIIDLTDKVYYKMRALESKSSNQSSSIAFEISGPGFWGPIRALIAIRNDLETIDGIKFLKHEETPGLGGRIDEEWFSKQFKGKKVKPKLIKKPYQMAKTENEFDAITGATQTSLCIEAIINNSVNSFCERLK